MRFRTLPPTPATETFMLRPRYALRWRYLRKGAPWLAAFLFLATFVDFGGALFVKLMATLIALLWAATRGGAVTVWLAERWDLLIFIGIPVVLSVLHAAAGNVTSFGQVYETISSPLLLLLLPLFALTGGARTQRLLLNLYILLALTMLAVGVLHYLGTINLASYTATAQEYRIGFIGIDPRQPGVASNLRPVVGPRVGYTLVFGLGLALPVSALYSVIIGAALVLLKARGMLLGGAALAGAWVLTTAHPSLRVRRRTLYMFLLVVLVVGVALSLSAVRGLLFTSGEELGVRLQQAWYAEDESTLIRLGHFQGYRYMVEEQPLGLLFGFGPGAQLHNVYTGNLVSLTEIALLNIALWYGIPYAALFFGTLVLAAVKLARLRRRPGFTRDDWGLALGALFFWLAGNTNPLLLSPITFFALMLIRVRTHEIRVASQHTAGVRHAAR